jgi:hypothetical protein
MMSSSLPRGPLAGALGRPVSFLDQTQMCCVHQPRNVDASRPGAMRCERASDCADILWCAVALGPDERQTVLKFAQGMARRRIQQAVDRRPIPEEGLRAHQIRNQEAHVGHSRHQVLEHRYRFPNSPRCHSR